ncbi:MAG: D-alanine--D-alanine ligase, partial [Aquiluna sp.]|nr:D-alanine--D-alanine ligase [Aquiluna sp.]
YSERYTPGQTDYYVPARLPQQVLDQAAEIALVAHKALGLRHLSRVDLIVDESGKIWFLEANVTPGMTETSLLPQAVIARGNELSETYADLARSVAKA